MSNLLDKASILLTPTAYNDGSMLSVKPNENLYGSELVVNGDFATDSDWTKDSNWSIVNGVATSTGVGRMYQSIPFLENNIGTNVKVTFDITERISGGVKIDCYGAASKVFTDVGTHTFIGKTTNSLNLYINNSGQGNLVGSIDNVSVVEDLSGDFQFSRNSAATRVNAQGLVENVQIISPELVSNGNFSQIGTEEVLNGNFSQQGSELITNGDFSNGLNNWIYQGDSITILDGAARLNRVTSTTFIQQNILTSSKTYLVEFDVLDKVDNSGTFIVRLGSNNVYDVSTYEGTRFSKYIVSNGTDFRIYSSSNNGVIYIDNVSVKEVGQNWDLGSGWSIGENKAISDATQGYIVQTNVSGAGVTATYKVQWTQNITAGTRLRFFARNYNDGGTITILSITRDDGLNIGGGNCVGSGTFTAYVSSTNGYSFKMLAESGVEASITNISVKEVGQDWTAKDGQIISANSSGLVFDNSTGNASGGVFQNLGLSSAKKYRMTATMQLLTASSNGTFTLFSSSAGGTSQSGVFSGSVLVAGGDAVTETFDFSPASGDVSIQFTCDEANATYKVSNVSVKEIIDDTDLPRIDYTDGCGSWLLEPQSTNLITYSEDFSDSSWIHNSDITTTNSLELAPNGELDANLIEYDGGGYSFIRRSISATSTAATLSVFAKKGNWRYLGFRNFQASGSDHTVFDFDTETFSNTASGQTASFEIFSNGWYRIKVTQPSPVSTSAFAGFAISNSSGGELNTTDGQVANVHLFGAQLEEQSYATSYIPTNGSIATRLQDIATNSGNATLINSTEGVLYAESSALGLGESVSLGLNDGSGSNRVLILLQSNGDIRGFVASNGTIAFDETYSGVSTLNNNKIAVSYKLNQFTLWINGVKRFTDTIGNTPIGLNKLDFDNGSGASNFYGKAKAVAVYKEALTDAELQSLTTI